VDYSASLSLSFQGELWQRADDPLGMAAAAGGISKSHKNFVVAAGSGILAGDGGLSHGWEKSLETYYSCELAKRSHLTADYQFITNPAFNRDRRPVSILGARLHWAF